MASKTKAIETLAEYFKEKGRVLSYQEYSRELDTPIRVQQIRSMFGTWNKVEKLLMAREGRTAPDVITDIDDVLAARNKAAAELEASWKEASENQDKKARREAEAQVVAETLAKNAATPEGANANKIAIGGPLPGEQPKYELAGATVNVDPVTKERTVVDVQPEIVDPKVTSDTPAGIKAQVEAENAVKTADVKTGDATDGGSQGSASIATVAALGGEGEEKKATTTAKATEKK